MAQSWARLVRRKTSHEAVAVLAGVVVAAPDQAVVGADDDVAHDVVVGAVAAGAGGLMHEDAEAAWRARGRGGRRQRMRMVLILRWKARMAVSYSCCGSTTKRSGRTTILRPMAKARRLRSASGPVILRMALLEGFERQRQVAALVGDAEHHDVGVELGVQDALAQVADVEGEEALGVGVAAEGVAAGAGSRSRRGP